MNYSLVIDAFLIISFERRSQRSAIHAFRVNITGTHITVVLKAIHDSLISL